MATWLVLGRANRRRVVAETEVVADLGRSNRGQSRWLRGVLVVIGLAHLAIAAGVVLTGDDAPDPVPSFAQGVGFVLAGLATRYRTWHVTERGVLAWHVEYPWAAFESVRVRRDAVHVQFASRVDGWLAAGAGGHLRFAREDVDGAAIELLETREETGPGGRRSRGTET